MQDFLFKIVVGTLILIAVLVAFVFPALAQDNCQTSISVILQLDRLGEVEHEMQTLKGEHGEEQWIIWLNEENGSWSLTRTTGTITCVMAGQPAGYRGQQIADFVKGAERDV